MDLAADLLQVVTFDQPHIHIQASVDFAEMVNRYDVRIVQTRRGVGLAAEPLAERRIGRKLCRQHLDRHHPIGVGVERAPNLPHSATAQQVQQPIAPKRSALQR